jgi:N-acetylglucosaminyldiphosphoundecaprenol N-acetyl-beta-D-mannosaminyltransferase
LAERGLRLFLLGSTPAVIATAAAKLAPAEIGCYAPPFCDLEGEETRIMIERVNAFAPDVLLVALGAPRQDVWIAQNLSRLRTHVAIGVGGTFDIISGRLVRCPALLGRIGLEWAYRLAQEPWRWRRCLRLARFLPVALTGGRA